MNLGKYKIYRFLVFLIKNTAVLQSKRKKVFYFESTANFGDQMNVFLCNALSSEKLDFITSTEFLNIKNYLCIGSVLQIANKKSIIWGSGFHFESSYFHYSHPKKVLAVRGPLTRTKLLAQNIYCPEIYGDPALLLPCILSGEAVKKYRIGVVPHYSNKDDIWLRQFKNDPTVLIIDVGDDPLTVVNQIRSCTLILSSSLHGLIISDAYFIPNVWIIFTKNIGLDNFKFYDYFQSVDREQIQPVNVKSRTLNEVLNSQYSGPFSFDPLPLIEACPFNLKKDIKSQIVTWYQQKI